MLDGVPSERLTSLQVHEDVSKGTPVSPVFNSAAELRRWLVARGVSAEAADEFLRLGSAPAFVLGPGSARSEGAGMVGPSTNA